MTTTYIVLGSDGRHVLLSHYEPEADEIEKVGASLTRAGLGGWIARMAGNPHRKGTRVTLTMVREAAPSGVTFEQAAALFRAARSGAAA